MIKVLIYYILIFTGASLYSTIDTKYPKDKILVMLILIIFGALGGFIK